MNNEEWRTIISIIALSLTLNCSQYNPNVYTRVNYNQIPADHSGSQAALSTKIEIKSVEFFAWQGERLKKEYVKLERLKDTSDSKIPPLYRFDVKLHIENMADSTLQEGDLIILTTLEFIIAYDNLDSSDVDKIINEHNWARVLTMDDVKMALVPYVKSKDRVQITFKDFDLSGVIKTFNGEHDPLWPWALKVNIHIIDRDMQQIAQGQAILPIIPADTRLQAQ